MSRITFWGVCIACAASAGSLAFFLLFVNPDYIGISGFAVFYASLFVVVWSGLFLAVSRSIRRKKVRSSLRHSIVRRTGLCAACVVGIIFLSHLDAVTWYGVALLVCGAVIVDHRFSER